ncbi:MAG: PD-(D/E)XK nuclease family protein [Clostridia bacterium]|nr:PD-(D/E)XK nuclease family protein [Clostridia bacterium]
MFYRVFGPVGSGKRAFLQSLARDAFQSGKRVFVLVPEQASADYERELVRLLGPQCSMLLEVTNFSRLSNVVLRTFGEMARRSITPEEKKLIISHVLGELGDRVSTLGVNRDPESVSALLAEWEELYRAGVSGEGLERVLADPEVSEGLKKKLEELRVVQACFRERVEGAFDDPAEEEERLSRVLEVYPFFENSCVIADLFWDFTYPQERILKQILRQAETVGISFTAKKGETALFEKSLGAARRLLALAREVGCEVRDEVQDSPEEGEIPFLLKHLAAGTETYPEPPKNIHVVACPDGADEARFIAATIRKKIGEGHPYSSFGVLTPTEGEKELLALTLEAEGIPVFWEEKKPLSASPASRTVLLAAKIASLFATEETVREYLTHALISHPKDEIFLLEKYVATWGLSGRSLMNGKDFTLNPDGYGEIKDEGKRELAAVNRARKAVFEPLRQLSLALAAGTNREKVTGIVAFLERIGAEKCLMRRIGQDEGAEALEEAGERVRMWNAVLERLSGIGRALGEEACDPEQFFRLLSISLSGELPGTVPPGEDRVHLGTAGFSRPDGVEFVFITNLNAGVFPAPMGTGKVFSETDRERLVALGFPVLSGDRMASEELFRFYLAASNASEELYLCYREGGDEETKGSLSVFGKRVLNLFPLCQKEHFSAEEALPSSPESALRYFLSHAGEDTPLQRELEDYFKDEPEARERLLYALAAKGICGVEENLRTVLPYEGRDIRMSYSRLEKYSECPFAYFARYLLEAKEERSASFGHNVTGTFVHRVLEKILTELKNEGVDLSEVEEAELARRNEIACREVALEMVGEEAEAEVRMQLRQIARSTLLILKKMKEEFAVSRFRPLFFEKDLTELAGGYRIPLGDGTELILVGSIDRVDLYTDASGQDYVRVIDYKTGKKIFRLEDVANGLDLQMLLYLFALWKKPLREKGSPAEPAGILYLSGMEEALSCKNLSEVKIAREKPYHGLNRDGLFVDTPSLLAAQDPEGKGEFIPAPRRKRRTSLDTGGLISLRDLGRLKRKTEADFVKMATSIRSGRVAPHPLYAPGQKDACEYCEFLPVCKRKKGCERKYLSAPTEADLYGEEE